MSRWKNHIQKRLNEAQQNYTAMNHECAPSIEQAAEILIAAVNDKKKVLICGNGGSAADSQHMAAELVVRYYKNRRALAAIALTTDTSTLTACSNDFSYEQIFSRQVEALGKKGDALVAISTSGNSKNILETIHMARTIDCAMC
jgi:D-sedoheptulose 7-phosphate isomerase